LLAYSIIHITQTK